MGKNTKIAKDTRPKNGLYYDNYDNGRITRATLAGVEENLYNAVKRCTLKSKYFDIYYGNSNGFFLDSEYTAKAKLHPDDVKNKEIGENVAHKKVMEKYHKAFDKRMKLIVEDINRLKAAYIHYCKKKNIDLNGIKTVEDFLIEYQQKK